MDMCKGYNAFLKITQTYVLITMSMNPLLNLFNLKEKKNECISIIEAFFSFG